jgi:hypothetical protein
MNIEAGGFDRSRIREFRFVRAQFDAGTGEARLVYAFDDGPELVETLVIPGAPFAVRDEAGLQKLLRLLHLLAGVSYYKAAVPPAIRIDAYEIDEATAAFLEGVYRHGLGEFAYRNGLTLAPSFPRGREPGFEESGSAPHLDSRQRGNDEPRAGQSRVCRATPTRRSP